MANIEKQHEIVKKSLFDFVNKHISGADLSVVDEIVLSYVISILEEASQDPCFDVDGKLEPMEKPKLINPIFFINTFAHTIQV